MVADVIRDATPEQKPTKGMIAAGAAVIQDVQAHLSQKTARLIWEAMWAASEEEREFHPDDELDPQPRHITRVM